MILSHSTSANRTAQLADDRIQPLQQVGVVLHDVGIISEFSCDLPDAICYRSCIGHDTAVFGCCIPLANRLRARPDTIAYLGQHIVNLLLAVMKTVLEPFTSVDRLRQR